MKNFLRLCAALLLAFTAATALAADVTGSWSGLMNTPDGNSFPLSFTFKQVGDKVTGSVSGPDGTPLAINDGKVKDDKLTFTIVYNGMTIAHEGVITADEIKMSSKTDTGEMPPMNFTLKRDKKPVEIGGLMPAVALSPAAAPSRRANPLEGTRSSVASANALRPRHSGNAPQAERRDLRRA